MKNKLSIIEATAAARALRARGEKFTLLGIGPMSKRVLRATLKAAQDGDYPIMFIASRNQVDSDEFGHGYVCGWDQDRFARDVEAAAKEVGFTGLCYLCRDHGGPWQRDEERSASLPEDEAIERCVRSYIHDMDAGFDLLHIDPTKDPAYASGFVPFDLVIDRTVDIIEKLEKHRKEKGLPPVGYEAGTEETNGGLTSAEAYGNFIKTLCGRLSALGIDPPAFVVGQTGTLVRLTENVGNFSRENASRLSEISESFGVGVKEHNADYLSDAVLLDHLPLGVTALNVAPEYAVVETRAYLELEKVERVAVSPEKRSDFLAVITRKAAECGRWRKWMVGDAANYTPEQVMADPEISEIVTENSGHYTYEDPAVKAELEKMLKNLSDIGVDGEAYVDYKLRGDIDRYAFCLGLHGLTSCLLAEAGK